MSTAARAYIAVKGTGAPIDNHHTCVAILEAFEAFTQGKHVGIVCRGLATPEGIEDEMLDVDDVMKLSDGRLPVIFVNITFENDELFEADLVEWEARFELKLLGSVVATF